jgi:predicted  nucleic acid-binding Zn-ribbon protein
MADEPINYEHARVTAQEIRQFVERLSDAEWVFAEAAQAQTELERVQAALVHTREQWLTAEEHLGDVTKQLTRVQEQVDVELDKGRERIALDLAAWKQEQAGEVLAQVAQLGDERMRLEADVEALRTERDALEAQVKTRGRELSRLEKRLADIRKAVEGLQGET